MTLLLVATKSEAEAFSFGKDDFKVVTVGVGLTQAAINTTLAINDYNPKRVISFGICKAIDPSMGIGDIVLGSTVCNYSLDLRTFKIPLGSTFDRDGNVINTVTLNKIIGSEPTFKGRKIHNNIHFGSADKFLLSGDSEILAVLGKELAVKAVDMESYSIAVAARQLEVEVSIARVVSDNYRGHRPKNFSRFLKESLEELCDFLESVEIS
ncbi:MAG: 5'-methylthioadenosine/S-adenosylhomocysteine nucleosidase [Sphaerochaetaceae bacterium]|jgi:adenosylhomocysteine nucleosidase